MPNLPQTQVKGLSVYNSQLSEGQPDYLSDCNNIVINRTSVAEQRRGFKIYGNAMGASPTADFAKQLLSYKQRILRHFGTGNGTTLQWDNGSGTFTSFSGTFAQVDSGIRIKGLESNGNFYFTSSDGIKKISVATASGLSSALVTDAGGVKALDLEGEIDYSQIGFFTQDSVVAYRIVWGINDPNENLVLGVPSARLVLQNSITQLLTRDFNTLLNSIDNAAAANVGGTLSQTDYLDTLKVNVNTSALTLHTALVALCSKLDGDMGGTAYATIAAGHPAPSANPTSAELLDLQEFYDDVVDALLNENISNITAAGQIAGNFQNSTQSAVVTLQFTVPDGITSDSYFYQIYRTAVSTSAGAASVDDLDPGDEMGLVFEANTTSAERSAGVISYTDIVPETFRGANLYTNPNSGEGILQANEVPPLARDVAMFKNSVFYANTQTKHRKQMALLGVSDLTSGVCKITIANGTTVNTYTFVSPTFQQTELEVVSGANYVSSGTSDYFDIYSGNDETHYRVWFQRGTSVAPSSVGVTLVQVTISGGETSAQVATKILNELNVYDDFTIVQGTTPVAAVAQVTQFTCVAGSLYTSSGTADYFDIYTGNDTIHYRFWIQVGTSVAPGAGGATLVQVTLTGSETANDAATAINLTMAPFGHWTLSSPSGGVFTATNVVAGATTDTTETVADAGFTTVTTVQGANATSVLNNELLISNTEAGITTNATETVANAGFTVTTTVEGNGEDEATLQVLLSNAATPAQQVDETTRSLIKVINRNASESVYGFYLSGPTDVPGQFLLEAKALGESAFYLIANSAATGGSFSPNISPVKSITNISVANPTVVSVTTHGLTTGDQVVIANSNSTPSIDGIFTVTVINANTFSIPVNVTVLGTMGVLSSVSVAQVSDNEVAPNRVYFSKLQQPEAVPLVNFFDVGPKDSAIERILALRDSLFVLKEDAIYRISGEGGTQGFANSLFDSSAVINATDSAVVLNNQIFFMSTQGVVAVSDTGVEIRSRSIESLLLPLFLHTNFSTASFGVSYESDRSYIVWVTSDDADTKATQCFRYNTFTNQWTKWEIAKTSGLVVSEKMYLGAADTNFIEQERKNFNRTDYADRELSRTILDNSVMGTVISVGSVAGLTAGDVFYQEQYLTVYKLNQCLIKLDLDGAIQTKDYYDTLGAVAGDNLRDILTELANKLDADPDVNQTNFASSISGFGDTFEDTQDAYNVIVAMLNLDSSLGFSNYAESNGTVEYEAIIDSIDIYANTVTLNLTLPFIQGPALIFEHIPVKIVFNPQFFGDSELYKQVSEAKFMFERTNFTKAEVSYSSDISPAFESYEFIKQGNGAFGLQVFGATNFGGNGDKSPFRTVVPRNKQRCRFLVCKIEHAVAREKFAVNGYSMYFVAYSIRPYRG